ncbi:MAG: DUF4271 domain-containing protein [Paludibacteraceae bacterium]|nr:DUF4271 domain-containing protein [Paludibacteraceae bacterium]
MGEGITHIVSSANAPWCGWTMLVLLITAVLAELFQPGVVTQAKSSLMAQNDRTYKESPVNFLGQLMITLFRIGVIAMSLYLCCRPTGRFSFAGFGVISAIVLAVFLVKMLSNIWVDRTFGISRRFGDPYEHYGNIATLLTLVLYPTVLVLMRVGNPIANRWVVGLMALLFIGVWLYRSIRQFMTSIVQIPYLLLYICTMEVLPIAILYISSDQIVTIL